MRIHFSNNIIERVEDFILPTHHRTMKPNGLYYSVEVDDSGWRGWCEAENFRLDRLVHQHAVELVPDRLRVIDSPNALRVFNQEYGEPALPDHPDLKYLVNINWERLAKDYAGIEANPYLYSCRMDMDDTGGLWYYGWDCSSGCVWDLSVVTKWEYIGEYEPKPVNYDEE